MRFLPGAVEYARAGAVPGGLRTIATSPPARSKLSRELPREIEDLLYDPQTSGGLLISLPEADAAALERALRRRLPHRPRPAAREKADPTRMKPNPIIVALDVDSAEEARALVAQLGSQVNFLQGRHGAVRRRRHGLRARTDQGRARTSSSTSNSTTSPKPSSAPWPQVARTGVQFLTAARRGIGDARRGRRARRLPTETARRHRAHQLRPRGHGRSRLRMLGLRPGGGARTQSRPGRHGWHRLLPSRGVDGAKRGGPRTSSS